jgi:tellurite resistance protein TehA-like permease
MEIIGFENAWIQIVLHIVGTFISIAIIILILFFFFKLLKRISNIEELLRKIVERMNVDDK